MLPLQPLVLVACASVHALPLDSLFASPQAVEPGISTRSETENDRITLGAKAMFRDFGDSTLVVWDTVQLRQDPTTDASGEQTLHALWSSGRIDASGKFLGRAGGLGAASPAAGENAWLIQGLGRWRWERPQLDASLIGGLLAESQDPGSLTQPLEPGETAGSGGTNVQGGLEASWHGTSDLAPFAEGFWIQDLLPSRLRWSRAGLATGAKTSVSGDGSDTLRLHLGWDTLRLRSSRLSANLGEGNAKAQADWSLRAGRHSWLLEGALERSIRNDATCRSPGLERRSSLGAVSLWSPLGRGASHAHRLELDLETRSWWTSPLAGSPDLWAGEDRKNDDETRTLRLSDTLAWVSPDTSWTISGILQQSLAEVRHPQNESPLSTDRPDEDLSVRMFTLSVRSARFAPSDRPLAGWTTIFQEDVFPRASQSIRTSRRRENRLWGDVALPIHEVIRPLAGAWAREQRNTWRFDSSRAAGLLDAGWSVGLEAGPQASPWVAVRFSDGTTKTGAILPEGFAPDRVQEDWIVSLTGEIPVWESLVAHPWGRWQLERTRSWDGSAWMAPDRSTSSRAGSDAEWNSESLSISLGAGHQWNQPGMDSWIAHGEARWIF
ncbi:MAG TPA: hypothetical protein PKY05_03670 [Fibrobacteria bacterium]|nr:hypothetical protein [Fibrobacteria bacterium]